MGLTTVSVQTGVTRETAEAYLRNAVRYSKNSFLLQAASDWSYQSVPASYASLSTKAIALKAQASG